MRLPVHRGLRKRAEQQILHRSHGLSVSLYILLASREAENGGEIGIGNYCKYQSVSNR